MSSQMAEQAQTEPNDAKAAGAKILEDYKDYPVGGVRLPEPNR